MKSLLSLLLAVGLHSQEVMTWVPPYRLSRSLEVMQHRPGGIGAEAWLSRLGLQFWGPTDKGDVAYVTHEEKVGDEDVKRFRQWAKPRGIKLLLCVFNHDGKRWNWERARAAFVDHRSTFVKALVKEMERLELDGIDLDLEGNGSFEADRPAFATFVKELSGLLKPKGKLLTIDSFHSPCFNAPHMGWWGDWAGLVDAVHSMGYGDLHEGSEASFKAQDGDCMAGATIFRFSWQVAWGAAKGLRNDQILLGLPGGRYEWGGKALPWHLQEASRQGAGICIWDFPSLMGGKKDARWGSEEAWQALVGFRAARGK